MLAISISLALVQNAAAPIVWYPTLTDDQRATADGVLMPGRAIVKKGSVIIFKGSLRDPNNPAVPLEGKIFLRSNSDTRATADVNGDYSITWDTRSESRPNTKVQLRLALKGAQQDTLIRSCELTLADTEPLSAQISQDAGGVTIKVQPSSGLSIDTPRVFVDGVEATTSGTDSLHVDPKYLASPNEKANVQIVAQAMKGPEKAGQIAAAGTVDGVQSLSLAGGAVGLTMPDNPFETFFAFNVTGAMKEGSASLNVNGRPTPVDQTGGQLAADPRYFSPNETGFVYVKATAPDGLPAFSKKIALTDLKVPETWISLANRIDEERAKLASVFALDLGKLTTNNRTVVVETLMRAGLGIYGRLPNQNESVSNVPLRTERTIVIRPLKKGARRTAVTRRQQDIGGITFRTVRVLPMFGQVEQFADQFKSLFGADWIIAAERKGKETSLPDVIASRLQAPEYKRALSFAGTYHKKICSELEEALTDWAVSIEDMRRAYKSAVGSPTKESVLAFVAAANLQEEKRLAANVLYGLLMVETGKPMPEIVSMYFIPTSRNQNDVDVVTSKRFESFDYVNTPIDLKMYP